MPGTRAEEEYAARYAALYKEHNAQLVSYARSLTGSATMAEDLAAEAHFRVWRRIQAGHKIENVAAYLTTTVRNLAAGLGRAQREIARDVAELPEDPAHATVHAAAIEDPEQRASHVDLITRLLKELPDRWAKALWYAEVEDLPMEAVGEKIGANAGTTAVVLTRARERLRQAFLLSQPGMPLSAECEPYWKHMATIVRGTASAKRTRNVTDHCDECDDCRSRMLVLTETNTRLPALLGPALLAGVLGGGAWFVPAVAGAGAAGAGAAAGTAAGTVARAGSRAGRHARLGLHGRLARHGLTPTKIAVGSVAAVGIAATVATLALGSTDKPNTSAQAALQTPPASSQPTPASENTAGSVAVSASAAATQAAATQAAAAPSTSAATSAAAAQSSPTLAVQIAQSQAPATTSAATTPAATTPVATSASATPTAAPSTSASIIASPIAVDTPTPTLTPTPSQSSTPVVTPTFTPAPTPSQTVTPTPSPSPTCWWYIFEYCYEKTTGGN
jgi:RNA polymerase sigma factor (sigma-70 family)